MSDFLPISAFGRLPYLTGIHEVRTGFPVVDELSKWLDDSLKPFLGVGAEREREREWLWSLKQEGRPFLVNLRNGSLLVAGLLSPSDSWERPRKPAVFVLFTLIPRRQYESRYGTLAMALEPVWSALQDAWIAVTHAPDRSAFLEEMESWRVPNPGSRKDLGDVLDAALERQAMTLVGQWGVSWQDFLRERIGVLVDDLSEFECGEKPLLVELPPAAELHEACFSLAFWSEMINRQFRKRHFEPSFFLRPRDEKGRLVPMFLFGEPSPDLFEVVVGPETRGSARWHRLVPTEQAGGEEDTRIELLNQNAVPSYQDLVRRW